MELAYYLHAKRSRGFPPLLDATHTEGVAVLGYHTYMCKGVCALEKNKIKYFI